jgi:CheY-like chemotaxis protein
MGGIIGVQSDGPGKGTRTYFSLPIWTDAVESPAPADESAAERIQGPVEGALVLIVEDDPVFRKFIEAVLHHHGYRTVDAYNAEAGWLLVRRLLPDIVVLDYALTCGEGAHLRTGWDLAQRIATDPETRRIPLVFVTGFDQEVEQRLHHSTFARKPRHLVKPIDGAALIATIEEVVGSVEGRHVRVLMADDDPAVAAFVRKVLPDRRFHIEHASNGEECLHILRTQPRGFDLLLLDLMMPEVSGYDVLREMALSGTQAELPVLVLTNYPQPQTGDEKRLLEQGLVLDVLSKTAVHDNPVLLSHIIDWHVQAAGERHTRQEAA